MIYFATNPKTPVGQTPTEYKCPILFLQWFKTAQNNSENRQTQSVAVLHPPPIPNLPSPPNTDSQSRSVIQTPSAT